MGTKKPSKVFRIVLIEDNEHDVIAFRRSFQKSNVTSEITHYERAEEALERLITDATSFDLVVTDYKLPGISGLDLCRELIQREVLLPIVLLTGAGSEDLAIEALKLGAYDYIIKDQNQGYLELLPVVLPAAVRKHNDYLARSIMEKKVRYSEKKYRNLFEHANDSIFIIDPDTRHFLDFNENAAKRLGYTKEELLKLPLDGIYTPVAAQRNDAIIKELMETGSVTFEHSQLYKNGKEVPVEISSRVIDYGGRQVIQSIVRDITERKLAEKALRASEERFRIVFETSPDSITSIRQEDGIYTAVNEGFTELFGYTMEDAAGKTSLDLNIWYNPKDREEVSAGIQKNGQVNNFETKFRHKDGRIIPVLISSKMIRLYDAPHILTVSKDISELKKAEENLKKRTHDLAERVKELNCLYSISHLVEEQGSSLEEILQGTIDLMPPSWRYPDITCARITLNGQEFKTENFKDSTWKQTTNINVSGEPTGTLEIFYLEERPKMDEGPFLKEERSLIDAIASRLGRTLEKLDAEEELKFESNVNSALSELYEPLISPSASIEDIAYTVLERAKNLTNSEHGYVSSIGPATGDMVVHTHTEMLKDQCRVTGENRRLIFQPEKDGHYPSLWGHSLNTLEAFYSNSPATHETSRGLPKGHIPVCRFLSVPVMLGRELVGQIALANKDKDYTEQDLEAISRVADFYALAIQRNRAKDELQKAHDELEQRVKARTAEIKEAYEQLMQETKERRIVQEQLSQSKGMLQAVFDGISEPLILVDKNMKIKMLNRPAAKYYGLADYQQALDKICYQATGKSDFCEGCEIPQTIITGNDLTFERKGFMDAKKLERIVIYPVQDGESETGDAIIRITDITEARQFERQIIQSEKMASLGILVSSIAHEINNPNSFVSFNVPILKDYVAELLPIVDEYAAKHQNFELFNMAYPEFRKDIIKLLENIEHGSKRISTFVSNLREYSLGKDENPLKQIELNGVIEKVLSICQSKIKRTVKTFNKNLPQDLPMIYTDPYALEQVLINLLLNAAQAADKKDSWVRLDVKINDSRQDHTIIEISDNGCGMDEKTQKNVFDPFFTTKTAVDGTGLGLYVTHNLIKDLGGRIDVQSEPGKGSKFTIILPDREPRH